MTQNSLKITAAALGVLSLSACGDILKKPQTLCSAETPGDTTGEAQLFSNLPLSTVCEVNASELSDQFNYNFENGRLIINGDIADGITINAREALVEVNGNIGNGVSLSSTVPAITREYTAIHFCRAPRVTFPCGFGDELKVLGYAYNENAADLIVRGNVGENSNLTSNRDLTVEGYSCSARINAENQTNVVGGFRNGPLCK